ncbi:hypothetical protein QJQ45_007958 [Haematococcus lacustris]|nr:hypothetical protein QJQ45_007958 [Haematococcus lacustris]
MQRNRESKRRQHSGTDLEKGCSPLEVCSRTAELPAKGKEDPGLGYERLELATGRAVYGALMSDAIIRQVTDHGMRPMFDNSTPQEYRQLATRCWDSNPGARPTAEELVQSLSAALSSLRGGRRPSSLPSRLHIPSPPCATGTDLPAGREVQPTSPGCPSPVTSPTTQLLQACRAAAPQPAALPKGPGMAAQQSTELPAQGREAQARQHGGQARRGREVTFKDVEEQDLRYRPSSAQVMQHLSSQPRAFIAVEH